ncbi:surface antigen [Naumannella cuiyingiana]|uniref:Surface antigen n=1 Tax=Naumannella cuiyingiana TaxID=1347891 RepID=A0A7Z0IL93_9ACTN|nr:CHAP domain-containing protein [Naumannella cuiyingiana]NYI71316.1 surface antigen [Naumannella cuiyingiana]
MFRKLTIAAIPLTAVGLMAGAPGAAPADAAPTDPERQKIVETAESQVGTVAGPGADKYFYGEWDYLNTSDDAWCAGFTSWVTQDQLGLQPHNEVGVEAYVDLAEANNGLSLTTEPKTGDFIVYDWDKNGVWDHIGIVKSIGDGTVTTIEGNTSGPKADSQVAEKQRDTSGTDFTLQYITIN